MFLLKSLLYLAFLDLLFLALLALIIAPICIKKRATFAVLKRNFVGYFSNPTGYVFLCLFVFLASIAAFWPHEFFNANLANLDQLNKYLPYIMLIFIPAITMSIWSEERRQGTDELLLTLPAGDFDIVVGKYIAAGAIFTASLLFSQMCSFAVLASLTLGQLDIGLFFATYLGYWFVGMAMLAVGMVASFLTSNLTVGFILGALFNAPLVFAVWADVIVRNPTMARLISGWSIAAQFDDFGRGVISLASTAYFVLLALVGLYLSMVLIGSRHWTGGRDGTSMLGHYLVRTIALVAVTLGANYLLANNFALSTLRTDLTVGQVSSLSPDTERLLAELDTEHTIKIEAFISGQVPEVYAKTRSDLMSMLKEFRASAGSNIDVQIHILDQGSEEAIKLASLAEKRYGLAPVPVRTRTRGAIKDEDIFLAAAFTCGLEKVVVPFFDYGIPVEYELIRSICTVAKKERKKVGIVRTDAQLFGGFSFAGGRPQNFPKQALVEELEKQYDVEEIDPSSPIEEDTYDVMIVAQPSSLGPTEFDNVVDAIAAGQPTAIFEDPRPIFMSNVPATGDPKMGPGGGNPMMGGGQPQPKGDIQKLWNLLGLDVPGETSMMGQYAPDIAWQEYNPYLKLQVQGIPDSWVFCRPEAPGADEAINEESPITSGLEEIFFPVPGTIKPDKDSELNFSVLVQTGDLAGTISSQDFMENQGNPLLMKAAQGRPEGPQIIAARITGTLEDDQSMSDAGYEVAQADTSEAESTDADATDPDESTEAAVDDTAEESDDAAAASDDAPKAEDEVPEAPEEETKRSIDVVYVADIDLMISTFLRIRARPGEDEEINWNFENVDFLLNIVDSLSGDDDYIAIRKRKPRHSTLRMVERRSQQMREEEFEKRYEFQQEYDKAVAKFEEENEKKVKEIQDQLEELQANARKQGQTGIKFTDLQEKLQELATTQERLNRKLEVHKEQLSRKRDDAIEGIRQEIELDILAIKNVYKAWAVFLPPIPPLLVGLIVYVRRRLREREGIDRSRLR